MEGDFVGNQIGFDIYFVSDQNTVIRLFSTDILSIIRQYAKTDKCPLNHCNFRLQIRSFANNLRNLSSKANLPNVWKWLFE